MNFGFYLRFIFITALILLQIGCKDRSAVEKKQNEKAATLDVWLNDTIVSPNQPWSSRIAKSFVLRHPGSVTYDQYMTKKSWTYEQGVILEALRQMWEHTGDTAYFNFIKENIDLYVSDDGSIRTYPYKDFNLDKINTGRQLLFLYEQTGADKYKIAADTLRKQLKNQPRTIEGGFGIKNISIPGLLDGLYML